MMRVLIFIMLLGWGMTAMEARAQVTPTMPSATIDLNGRYEFLAGYDVTSPADLPTTPVWGACGVPGLWWEAEGVGENWTRGAQPGFIHTRCAWYRWTFDTPENAALGGATLEYDGLLWGAEVWLNGKWLGRQMGGYAPLAMVASEAIRSGQNEIVMKIAGWPSIPRDDSGRALLPVAVEAPWANRSGGFIGDVRLRLHGAQRIEWIQMIPYAAAQGTQARVRANMNLAKGRTAEVRIEIRDEAGVKAAAHASPVRGPVQGSVLIESGFLKLNPAKLWSPDSPHLYRVTVSIVESESEPPSDVREERFGLRDFEIRGTDLYLNGERIMLRGASLWEEVRFKRGREAALDREFMRRYLVDVPRRHNMNVLRSHLGPIYNGWLDVADEGGMMIILEFPIFYWNGDERFRAEQMRMYQAMLPRLWNHPSIIIWAYSNEGWNDPQREFERETVEPWFESADPTRPQMRSGDLNEDFADIHAYEGIWHGTTAEFEARHRHLAARWGADKPLANSEYLETGGGGDGIWFSRERARRFVDDELTSPALQLRHAEMAMEQTELLRRMRFDVILPYWYSDWVNDWDWVANYRDTAKPNAKPTLAAIGQALAPVGVNLKTERVNVAPGQQWTADLWLINDTGSSFSGRVKTALIEGNPMFDAANINMDVALASHSLNVTVPAHGATTEALSLKIPDRMKTSFAVDNEFKTLFAVAVLMRLDNSVVAMSQRPVYVRPVIKGALQGRRIGVAGADPEAMQFLTEQGATLILNPADFDKADVFAIMHNESGRGESDEQPFEWMRSHVEAGRRCVVLNAMRNRPLGGTLDDAADAIYNLRNGVDWIFAAKGSGLPDLRDVNGPAPALLRTMKLRDGDEALMHGYPDSSGRSAPAIARRPVGEGDVIFCMLDWRGRLASDSEWSDPAVQGIFEALLKQ